MVLQNGALFSARSRRIPAGQCQRHAGAAARGLRHRLRGRIINDRFPGGYETVLEQNAANLSGGQKAKAPRHCARHCEVAPKILILDDSTSAVDMATDEHIRRALKTAMPGSKKIIIAAHRLDPLVRPIIVLARGASFSDVGTHVELMERSQIYRDVYDSQMRRRVSMARVERNYRRAQSPLHTLPPVPLFPSLLRAAHLRRGIHSGLCGLHDRRVLLHAPALTNLLKGKVASRRMRLTQNI